MCVASVCRVLVNSANYEEERKMTMTMRFDCIYCAYYCVISMYRLLLTLLHSASSSHYLGMRMFT